MARPTDMPQLTAASDRVEPAAPQRRVLLGQSDSAAGDGLEAQMQRAWQNLFDAIKAAGYEKRHLVKTTVCVTEGGQFKLFRTVRDRMMRGHLTPSAYLHVPGLGAAGHQVEVEGELLC